VTISLEMSQVEPRPISRAGDGGVRRFILAHLPRPRPIDLVELGMRPGYVEVLVDKGGLRSA